MSTFIELMQRFGTMGLPALLLMVVAVPLGMVAGMLIGPMLVKATSGGAAIFALGLFALVVYVGFIIAFINRN